MVRCFPPSKRQISVPIECSPRFHRIPLRLGRVVDRHIIGAQRHRLHGGKRVTIQIVPSLVSACGNRSERPARAVEKGCDAHLHICGTRTRIIRTGVPNDVFRASRGDGGSHVACQALDSVKRRTAVVRNGQRDTRRASQQVVGHVDQTGTIRPLGKGNVPNTRQHRHRERPRGRVPDVIRGGDRHRGISHGKRAPTRRRIRERRTSHVVRPACAAKRDVRPARRRGVDRHIGGYVRQHGRDRVHHASAGKRPYSNNGRTPSSETEADDPSSVFIRIVRYTFLAPRPTCGGLPISPSDYMPLAVPARWTSRVNPSDIDARRIPTPLIRISCHVIQSVAVCSKASYWAGVRE